MEATERQPSLARVAIVACTKQKRSTAAPAIELYDRSPLFRLSVAAARRHNLPVLVLSSKYGLVKPDTMLQPYEADLRRMSAGERSIWQATVAEQLRALIGNRGVKEVVCFAGPDYRRTLREVCKPLAIRVCTYPGWQQICDEAFRREDV